MKSRRFLPTTLDALEDRLVMSAFTVPFTIVTPPASQVNPKFLNLTGRTESQINSALSSAFNRFGNEVTNAFNSYNKGLAKSGADSTALLNTFQGKVTTAFNHLSSAMTNVSHKLPFGGVNLNPVLQNRIVGSTGVTDTTTNVNTPSLQTQVTDLFQNGQTSDFSKTVNSTFNLVRSDVNTYINQGVTFGYFRLTRGATLPHLS
jgi:hypothetical protein